MPITPKGYTDKAAVEAYMLITIDSSFDTQVDEWIAAAEEIIDGETNRDFAVFDEEEGEATDRLYDGDGSQTLYIGPATEVVSVKLDPDGDEIDADQFFVYPANTLPKTKIKLPYLTFPEGSQNIVVNAKYGASTMKGEIKFAATVLVAGIINFAWNSGSNVRSMTMGRYSVTYKTDEQKEDLLKVQDILERNKRYTF